MKQFLGFNGIMLGGAAALMAIQPAIAAPVQVTSVQLVPSGNGGINLLLKTEAGERPQVFAVNRGSSWTADITNTRLKLPGGGNFQQDNPIAGISRVTVTSLDANSVRVTVVGQGTSPTGQISRPSQGGLLFSVVPSAGQAASPQTSGTQARLSQAPAPEQPAPAPVPNSAPPTPATPASPAQPGAAPPSAAPFPTNQSPLVPNPDVRIQGAPNTPSVPPLLPRAVAPPVGDIAATQVDPSPASIDLGSNERVRLVLKDAPAREVLALLARQAGLNIAFTADTQGQPGQPGAQPGQPGATTAEGPRISLDVDNESVQDVFNYVLRISGLEANRIGRTIFVAPRLPNSARNLVIRSLRLNQVPVTSALNFLVSLGAETAVSRERLVTSLVAIPVTQLTGAQSGAAGTQSQTTTEQRVEVVSVEFRYSNPILRGLAVSGDERTNTITLVGSPRQVDIAVAQLLQLDVRRRQVVVNVRVIDVNLLAIDRIGTSFSFGINDTQVVNQGGVALLNFGSRTPGGTSTPLSAPATFGNPLGTSPTTPLSGNPIGFANRFLLQLQAAVTSGNAKILTDPSLVVQEGQTATVRLIEEIVSNIEQETTTSGVGQATTTVTVEKGAAGLILSVKVDRIDDNGFVALSVAPTVSQPIGNVTPIQGTSITLLSERRLDSGQVRLRDGQTLVLTGIIQDQDRTSVTKVPILGDLPLLGALFRRTERANDRREVIVLVTPRVIDDSEQSNQFGYTYTPGSAVQQLLQEPRPGSPAPAPQPR